MQAKPIPCSALSERSTWVKGGLCLARFRIRNRCCNWTLQNHSALGPLLGFGLGAGSGAEVDAEGWECRSAAFLRRKLRPVTPGYELDVGGWPSFGKPGLGNQDFADGGFAGAGCGSGAVGRH